MGCRSEYDHFRSLFLFFVFFFSHFILNWVLFPVMSSKLCDIIYEQKTCFPGTDGREVNAKKSSWSLWDEEILRHCATGAGASFVQDLERSSAGLWAADRLQVSSPARTAGKSATTADADWITNCSRLLDANFPCANFAFAYISPAYVRARGSSSQQRTQAHWPELQGTFIVLGLSYSAVRNNRFAL